MRRYLSLYCQLRRYRLRWRQAQQRQRSQLGSSARLSLAHLQVRVRVLPPCLPAQVMGPPLCPPASLWSPQPAALQGARAKAAGRAVSAAAALVLPVHRYDLPLPQPHGACPGQVAHGLQGRQGLPGP